MFHHYNKLIQSVIQMMYDFNSNKLVIIIFQVYKIIIMLDVKSEMQPPSRKSSQLIIPEGSQMGMDIILEQLKYKNNKDYHMKLIKNFRPQYHFKILNGTDIFLVQQSSHKINFLFILLFSVNSNQNQHKQMLTKLKEFVYYNNIIIPKKYPIESIFWEQSERNIAIRTIFAKLFTEITYNNLTSWLTVFQSHQIILLLYDTIFRNLLTKICKNDKYLDQSQITIQDLQILSEYFNFDIYKTKPFHFCQGLKGLYFITNKEQQKIKPQTVHMISAKSKLPLVEVVGDQGNNCFCFW